MHLTSRVNSTEHSGQNSSQVQSYQCKYSFQKSNLYLIMTKRTRRLTLIRYKNSALINSKYVTLSYNSTQCFFHIIFKDFVNNNSICRNDYSSFKIWQSLSKTFITATVYGKITFLLCAKLTFGQLFPG